MSVNHAVKGRSKIVSSCWVREAKEAVSRKVRGIVFIASILAVLPCLIQPCTPAYAKESKSEYWAVIIGVSNYQNIKGLNYSSDDARALSQLLSPVWGNDHIKLLLDNKATKANILAAIDWLADEDGANDTDLLYFSGHTTSDGYMAPYDADSEETFILSGELKSRLAKLDSKKVALILDTCDADQFEPDISGSGRVILMSSGSGETSYETGVFGHSYFSYYLLQALGRFDSADSNGDYALSAEEIFGYADPKTVSYAALQNRLQHPVLSDGYPGELDLLVKFILGTKPNLPSVNQAFVVDGETYPSVPPPFIWAPGSTHNLSVSPRVDTGTGTRYVFTSWNDGDTSSSIAVTQGAHTANYTLEYQLHINSTYGQPLGAGWYSPGSTAAISAISIEEPTVRHIFTGWSGDLTKNTATTSLTMNSPKTITANWLTEYLLTIVSPYSNPEGAGWYNEGSMATISVTSIVGTIIRHVFTGWSGDFTENTATTSLTMNSPKTITANWRTDYTQLYMLIVGLTLIIAATIVGLHISRKIEVI